MSDFVETPVQTEFVCTKFRKIKTDIPSPTTLEILRLSRQYESDSLSHQIPLVWDRARGFNIWDKSGNCWIDLTSAIFVANIGHSHPKVCKAIKDTVEKGLLSAYDYVTEERAELAKLLVAISPNPLNKVVLTTTGSEANEVALKMMIMTGQQLNPNKNIILSYVNSFHGKTLGSQLLGGKLAEKQWIPSSINPRIIHLQYPYPWILEEVRMTGKEYFYYQIEQLKQQGVKTEEIAGIISESYQGWCAVFLPVDYVRELKTWSVENNVLIAFDEVQSGFGRTGRLFAFEHYGIVPNIVVCGKALSSSLPISAVITEDRIANICHSFTSTHGGNPVGAAASVAAIKVLLEEGLVKQSEEKGQYLNDLLLQWQKEQPQIIKRVFCKGLLASVFIEIPNGNSNKFVDDIVERAFRKGVLCVRTASGTLKFGPPLCISTQALKEALDVIKECTEELKHRLDRKAREYD